jgi:hypothetical protein
MPPQTPKMKTAERPRFLHPDGAREPLGNVRQKNGRSHHCARAASLNHADADGDRFRHAIEQRAHGDREAAAGLLRFGGLLLSGALAMPGAARSQPDIRKSVGESACEEADRRCRKTASRMGFVHQINGECRNEHTRAESDHTGDEPLRHAREIAEGGACEEGADPAMRPHTPAQISFEPAPPNGNDIFADLVFRSASLSESAACGLDRRFTTPVEFPLAREK